MSNPGTSTTTRGTPRRLRLWRTPARLAVLFSLVMALGGIWSAAAAPQLPDSAGDSQFQATGTASLEFDVVRCPEGFDPNDLFGTCTDFGVEDIEIQVVSVDPALAIDQSRTTAQESDPGPGRTSFTNLPAGDYNVSVDLPPEEGVRYYIYCGIAGGGQPLPASPDDALDTVVNVPDGAPVACDLYIIPTEAPPQSSIDLFAFTCAADAVPPEGDREFSDFQAACTQVAPDVDFHLVTDDDTDTLETTDEDGRAQFSYPAGDPVRFYSGVPLEADEWLFCSVDQGEADEITIDQEGVSTFPNATAEDLTCSWFVAEEAEATATATATGEATEEATATATLAPTESPTEAPAEDATIDLTAFTCDFDAVADPGSADFGDFQAACGDVAPGVDFHLNTGELQGVETSDENGRVSFTFPVGDEVDFYAAVPLEADEYLFCSTGGDASTVEMDDQGVAHFANTEAAALICSWFLVEDAPPTATATATTAPAEEPTATTAPSQEPTETLPAEQPLQPDDLGNITIIPLVCPQGYEVDDPAALTYEQLAAECDQGVEDVSFTFGYTNGDQDIRVSDGVNPITFTNLAAGTYTLYSSVPLEAAAERSFCTSDGGNQYEREFNDRGVTTFADLATEQIECEWYIIPINLRGEETGGSLEIHLVACPVGYNGNQLFDDCHSNGLDDFEFVLDGPGGEQTGTTEILQPNGPGVVTFTSLAAGDYEFRGGPPGDFGTIKLFCSNQPNNGEPEYGIDGAVASLTLAENQHVLCDWYFIPDDQGETTPTPTPEPERAEILVTLFACPAGNYGGSTLGTFEDECTEKVDGVTFRLGDPDSAPLSAKTGASGEGAVRFFDLLPGDLTMTPSLPANLTSAAVFCTIDDGDPYQKALSNGGTTFVNVEGESIACSWFAVEDRAETPASPAGSITIREYLCEKDRSEITDWDAECKPGSTGTSYTIQNSASGASAEGTPNKEGVFVFGSLPDGFYTLKQNTGNWCRAIADRVDSQSRVIVQGGGNTDVVLYQCNAVEGLPVTGTGPGGTITADDNGLSGMRLLAVALALFAVPLAWAGVVHARRQGRQPEAPAAEPARAPVVMADGRVHMRFR